MSAAAISVLMKRKVERGLRKLPSSVQQTMDELAEDLRELGPIRTDWSNFGPLKGRKDEYHCHLSGSYSACWRWEKDSTLIEVFRSSMSVAEKARTKNSRTTSKVRWVTVSYTVPVSEVSKLETKPGFRLLEPDDEELIDIHESDWHKEISATRTPGRALRVYRENRDLSQSELAKKLGETRRKQYVADMEAGRRGISKEMAKKLARILNAPVERFL